MGETKYTEEKLEQGTDFKLNLLDMVIAEGNPYVFAAVEFVEPDGMNLVLRTGNGIFDKEATRALLEKVLEALPVDDETEENSE